MNLRGRIAIAPYEPLWEAGPTARKRLQTTKKMLRDRSLSRYTYLGIAVQDERVVFVTAVAPVVDEQRQRFGDHLFSSLES
jgi:hypothetical protein